MRRCPNAYKQVIKVWQTKAAEILYNYIYFFFLLFLLFSALNWCKSGRKSLMDSRLSGTSQTVWVLWMGNTSTFTPPPGTGPTFYNYKHTFFIVLMALVDSNYRFLYLDVGCNGRKSDWGVFGGWMLTAGCTGEQNIQHPTPLSEQLASYCIVADEAFPLKDYLL